MQRTVDEAVLSACPEVSLRFDSKHIVDVRLVFSSGDQSSALRSVTDEAVLLAYESSTYAPIRINYGHKDYELALYDESRFEILHKELEASDNIYTPRPYNYILVMPTGTLPSGGFTFIP